MCIQSSSCSDLGLAASFKLTSLPRSSPGRCVQFQTPNFTLTIKAGSSLCILSTLLIPSWHIASAQSSHCSSSGLLMLYSKRSMSATMALYSHSAALASRRQRSGARNIVADRHPARSRAQVGPHLPGERFRLQQSQNRPSRSP
jgi:hypothetical protein